jgi:catechol 2,3-dioxygenase-like lactoylglutathione lyase family enzyme
VSANPRPGFAWAKLVPELMVSDLAASLRFWTGPCGFSVAFERPETGFVCVERGAAQVMIEDIRPSRWRSGTLERPLGRGVNLMIEVDGVAGVLDALAAAGWPLFRPPEDAWYRVGAREDGVRQFLVQDPDGYLLRFFEPLGSRPLLPGRDG